MQQPGGPGRGVVGGLDQTQEESTRPPHNQHVGPQHLRRTQQARDSNQVLRRRKCRHEVRAIQHCPPMRQN